MKGKRGSSSNYKNHPKKVKRSKKFWQQRKTNTISQVASSESENDDTGSIHDGFEDNEPTTEYQTLLETFSNNENSGKIAIESENEDSEDSENESGICTITITYLFF